MVGAGALPPPARPVEGVALLEAGDATQPLLAMRARPSRTLMSLKSRSRMASGWQGRLRGPSST